MRRLLALLLVLVAAPAFAQQQPPFQQMDVDTTAVTSPRVYVGLFTAGAGGAVQVELPTALSSGGFKVACVTGCSGGTTDTDDASVATGQVTGLSIGLTHVYDGSVWRRLTIGVAGTAAAQVLTVQGIAGGTNLNVNCAAGCIAGGSFNDNSAFTFGTTAVGVAGFVFDDVAPNAVTEDNAAAARMSANRVPYSTIRDAAGNERGALVTANNELLVELGAGTAAVGTVDTELPAAAALSDTIGNPTTPMIGAGNMVWDGSANWVRAKGDANGQAVQGSVAHDGANVQNTKPFAGGGRASAAVPADVSADNDAVMAWYLRSGAAAIQPTFGGVLASVGNGGTGTGVMRVAQVNDGTGVLATVSTVTSLSQLGGVALPIEDAAETAAGVGVYAMGVRRDAAASSAGTTGDNATLNTDANGLAWTRQMDPCSAVTKTYFPVNISTATTTVVAAASASNFYYICAMNLFSAGTQNVAFVEDATGSCASPDAGIYGGTTTGTGYNLIAQTGIAQGNGQGSIARTASTNVNICLITSAAVQISGVIAVVAAP